MRVFLTVICFLATLLLHASPSVLREDEEILRGTLDNGLSYYVRHNDSPEKKASLRLVVRVGSNQETEEERGIAHFIEHLVFRGSAHFGDKEVEKYLASIGAWFGTDANAYTSFDSTVYSLDIPLNQEGVLETALRILRDFASSAQLSQDVIDKEREVVLDELHQKFSDPEYRYDRLLVETLLPNSLYAIQSPGGDKEVIQRVSQQTLRNFYDTWYRPERMAVIAVGDFDPEVMQEVIAEEFGGWEARAPEPDDREVEVELAEGGLARIFFDAEAGDTRLDLIAFVDPEIAEDLFDDPYKPSFYTHVCSRLLEGRLQEVEEAQLLFLNPAVDTFSWYGDTQILLTSVSLFEDSYIEGLHSLHYEIQKVLQHGFYPSEWGVVRHQLEKEFEKGLVDSAWLDHEDYASECVDHFIEDGMLLDRGSIYSHFLQMTRDSSLDELNAFLPYSPFSEPSKIFLCTSSALVGQGLAAEDLLALFDQACDTEEGIEEKGEVVFSVDPKFPPGQVERIEILPAIDGGVWTLSNGIRLIYKRNRLHQGAVQVLAFAEGGILSLPQEWYPSAHLAMSYRMFSGMEGISFSNLYRVLSDLEISWSAELNANSRTFSLHAPKENLEAAFQVIHAFYASPVLSSVKWQQLIVRAKEMWKEVQKNPEYQFLQHVRAINTQGHSLFDPVDADRADQQIAQRVLDACFAQPKEFTFVVVGDFEIGQLQGFVETYLASLPNQEMADYPVVQLDEMFPKEVIVQEYPAGNKPFVTQVISIPFSLEGIDFVEKDRSLLSGVTQLLSHRLWERLRNELGKTYGVYVSLDFPFAPEDEVFDFPIYSDLNNTCMQIIYTCQNSHKEDMAAAALEEIEQCKQRAPSQEEVESLIALFDQKYQEVFQTNAFWSHFLLKKRGSLETVNGRSGWSGGFSPEALQQAAQLLFSSPYYSVLSHVPEE